MTEVSNTGWWMAGLAGVSLLVGLGFGYQLLVAAGIAGITVFVTAFFWAHLGQDMDVRRQLSADRVERGTANVSALITIRNRSTRISPGVAARERVGDGVRELLVPRLAPSASWSDSVQVPSDRRAVVRVGPTIIRRSDPFGVVRADADVGGSEVLYVHPRRYLTERLPLGKQTALDTQTHDSARGRQVFHAVREYVAGDDRRQIHWRTTAKFGGKLMVREHIDVSQPNLVILLDNCAHRQSPQSFEECVDVVASIGCAVLDGGSPLRFVPWRGVECEPTRGDRKQEFLDYLAGIEIAADVPDAKQNPSFEAVRALAGHSVVLITTPLPSDVAMGFAGDLRQFGTRDVIVVGAGASSLVPGTHQVQGVGAAEACEMWAQHMRTVA